MKNALLALLLLPAQLLALGTYVPLSGGSQLPAAYTGSAPSLTMSCRGANKVEILNYTTSALAWNWTNSNTVVPTEDFSYVPAGSGGGNTWTLPSPMGSAAYLYVRAPAGAVSSGSFYLSCWYEGRQ